MPSTTKRRCVSLQRKRARRIRYRPGNAPKPYFSRVKLPVKRRRRHFRVVNRRRFVAAQAVLALVVVVALGLSASVIVRSIRTARLNRQLAELYGVSGEAMQAEIAAPPIGDENAPAFAALAAGTSSSPYGELSAMVMPDGSPIIVPETVELSPEETGVAEPAVFHRTDLDIMPEMRELVQRNPDTVGWISISGTVHLPVVYRDNVFYLDHDFTGSKNASGTLFLDENSPVNADTQNLLIHGHSMNDGSMFGILTHYRKLDFVKQHPMVAFSTLWERESYAVFAVLQVSSRVDDANYFNYFSSPTFASASDFDAYIDAVEARSMFQIPVDVEPDDALLTLSTCLDDDRLVVLARRLRPGESKDAIVSAVEEAYKS